MIITCKKCQKKLQIGEADLRPGSVFGCPSCGNTIRMKSAESPQGQSDQWIVRANGEPFGPYSLEQMLEFIPQGRILPETEVQHPRFTQGLWMRSRAVGPLRDRLGDVDSPPIQEASTASNQSSSTTQSDPGFSVVAFLTEKLSVPPAKLNRLGMFARILIGVYAASLVLCLLVTPLMVLENSSGPIAGNVIRVVFNLTLAPVLFTGFALLYFVPSAVAYVRSHRNTIPILVLNLFFGLTLIGWAICLAWSFTADVNESRQRAQVVSVKKEGRRSGRPRR